MIFSRKKSVLVKCKIFRLFVNPLTADDKYSLLNWGNLLQHFQIQLSKNEKKNDSLFLHFWTLDSILNILKKKTWPSQVMYFWTYGRQKTWLYICLKSLTSEDPLGSNVVNGPKHCWTRNSRTFTIFSDHH